MRALTRAVLGLAVLAAAVVTVPASADEVVAPFAGVGDADGLVITALSPAIPDVASGNAGEYRCDFGAGGHYQPQKAVNAGTVSYVGYIACNNVMRGIDAYARLFVSHDNRQTWRQLDSPVRATCVDCAAPSHGAQGETDVIFFGRTYWRVQADFTIGFPGGKAWRFSPLCSPPSGNIVTCRRFAEFVTDVPA